MVTAIQFVMASMEEVHGMPVRRIIEQTLSLHDEQHTLCERLEAVADGLPLTVDQQECLLLARDIYPTIKEAHRLEELDLFPHLQSHVGTKSLADVLERLRFEHWEDEAYAEEIGDALRLLGRGGEHSDADKVCWMLRGFFEGVRRHIAFETEHLLPMLQSPANTGSRAGEGSSR